MDFDGLNDLSLLLDTWDVLAAAHALRLWLQAPSSIFVLPTASRTESLWLLASLLGLLVTTSNLSLAVRSWRWQRRFAAADDALREVARARLERALGFAAIDVICVVMGLAAVLNAAVYPFVLLFGLLALRLLLPVLALRDFYLYRQIVRLTRRKRHTKALHQAKYQPQGKAPHG